MAPQIELGARTPADSERSAATGGQRQHVVLLVTDVCGYTALGESTDPEDIDDLRRHFEGLAAETIRKRHGVLTQVVGDGLLALFGYPQPHEDGVRQALETALELHELTRGAPPSEVAIPGFELRLHTGVHCGLVFIAEGNALHGRFRLTGDAVNTAARLCTVADRDEILVSEAALRGLEPFYSTGRVLLQLKGKRAPLPALRVLGRTAIRTRFEARSESGLTPFVARAADLDLLSRCLLQAAYARGEVLAICGPAGVGKTRLLDEFRKRTVTSSRKLLRGSCEDRGDMLPLGPFVQALRQLFGLPAQCDVREAKSLVAQRLAQLDAALVPALPTFLRLLSFHDPFEVVAATASSPIAGVLSRLVAALCAQHALVLILDDWQWADEASRALLDALCTRVHAQRILIVLGVRSDEPVALPHGCRQLQLEPFSECETRSFVGNLRARPLGLALTRALHRKSGGNALFLEELCRSLPEQGVGAQLLGSDQLPSSVQGLIQARIARLGVDQLELLRVASVIGVQFTPAMLDELLPGKPNVTTLASLLRSDLSQVEDGRGSLRFNHGIARDVIYASIRASERRRIHLAIAHALASGVRGGALADRSEALAHHYRFGGDPLRAAEYGERAGANALERGALDRAHFQYRAVLAELDKLPPSAALKRRWLQNAAHCAASASYNPDQAHVQMLGRALAYASELGETRSEIEAATRLGCARCLFGDYAAALRDLERALQLAQENGRSELLARIWVDLGHTYQVAGDIRRATESLTRGLQLLEHGTASHAAVRRAQALSRRAMAHADRGDFDAASADLREANALAPVVGVATQVSLLLSQALVAIHRADFRLCATHAAAARSLLSRLRSGSLHAFDAAGLLAQVVEGYARFMLAVPRTAAQPAPAAAGLRGLEQLREATDRLQALGLHYCSGLACGWLANAFVRAGRPRLAEEYARRALARGEAGDRSGIALAHHALARLGPAGAAAQHLLSALEAASARGSEREVALTEALAVELELELELELGISGSASAPSLWA